MGLLQYAEMDSKLVNRCKIQNTYCSQLRAMPRLKLFEAAEEEYAHTQEGYEVLTHNLKVLKKSVSPWFQTDQLVCGDLYFASVTAAEELAHIGLWFIDDLKTAATKFPMEYLQTQEIDGRGDHIFWVSLDD